MKQLILFLLGIALLFFSAQSQDKAEINIKTQFSIQQKIVHPRIIDNPSVIQITQDQIKIFEAIDKIYTIVDKQHYKNKDVYYIRNDKASLLRLIIKKDYIILDNQKYKRTFFI